MKVSASPARRVSLLAVVAVVGALFPILLLATPAQAATFSNNTAINNAEGPATCSGARVPPSLYPSPITVSGQTGTIQSVSVTLKGMTGWNNDFDVLLVGPGGQKLLLLADSGSALMTGGGVTLTLADAGASLAPQTGAWTNGATYKPTDYDVSTDGESFPSPAPAAPYGDPAPAGSATFSSVFGGGAPNGTWNLYLTDDCLGDPSSITGGWDLNITSVAAAATTTSVTSSNNPSLTGSNVTFTATVTSGGSPVTSGTVTFTRGATTLASNVAVNGSGQAAFTTSALTEGTHTITGTYNGTASFSTSNGAVVQTVDNATVVTGGAYCNTGGIAVGDNGATTPYPSRVFVTGEGAVSKLTVTVKNVTHPHADDLDLLLVGPTGVKYLFVGDAGGSPDVNNQTLTFDDDAAAGLTDNAGGWTSGTWRPSSFNDGTDAFLSPAPAGPYQHAQPTGTASFSSLFGGTDPNGTWQLFVHDDALGDVGAFAGGWCLNITSTSDPATVTDLTSTPNPSATGQSVTFTAQVRRQDNNANVTVGTVTFRDGANVVSGPTAVNASGIATWTTSSLTEGQHAITASYSGVAGSFNLSSDSLTQTVIDPTTVIGSAFCNTGSFPINDGPGPGSPGTANPYPSQLTVSGLSGNVGTVSITLRNVSHSAADDVDILLVGPGGQKFVVVSDGGGGELTAGTELSNVTVTFTDTALTAVPDSTTWGAPNSSVSLRPTDHNDGTDEFPSPAPAGPYSVAAPAGSATFGSVFAGTPAAGVWSLYVADDTLSDTGTIGDGWCLNVTVPVTAGDDEYDGLAGTTLNVPAPGVLADDGGYPAPSATAIAGGTTAEGGTVTLNSNGSFAYTPPAGFDGVDSFTYTAGNGTSSDTATVTIDVLSVPVLTVPADFEVTEDPVDGGTASVPFSVSATGNPTPEIECTFDGNTVTSPVVMPVGDNVVECTATNTAGSDTESFTVTVKRANNLPVADAGGPYDVDEGESLTLDASGTTDADSGDTLTYTWDVNGDGTFGDATGVSPTLTWTDLVALGIDDGPATVSGVKVRASDGRPGSPGESAGTSIDVGNTAPTVAISGPTTVGVGELLSLTFDATDESPVDQAGAFTYDVDWGDGDTDEDVAGGDSLPATHTYASGGTYTVTVTATDKDGATSTSDTAQISVQSVPVLTVPADFQVTESPADSGSAEVTFAVSATGSPTPTIECVEGADPVTSPVTLAVGSHQIDCTATNDAGSDSESFTVTVVMANNLPVADAGGPYAVDEGQGLGLDAGGSSDADAGDTLTYSWDVNGDGTFGDATGVSPTLTWADLVALGIDDGPDTVTGVKVRVDDGRPGTAPDSAATTIDVGNVAPSVTAADGGGLSGQSVGFGAEADDPSPADDAGSFTWDVDWGDGTTSDDVADDATLSLNHSYTSPGTYTVTVTATDKDGATSTADTATVTVAGTGVTPDPCNASANALVVYGTPDADTIELRPGRAGRVNVFIGGSQVGSFGGVSRLIVLAGDGNDTVSVRNDLEQARLIYGEGGNDTIVGGVGPALLIGGDGNDFAQVGVGRNILVGGDGQDTLRGGDGEDLLVSGATDYDAPSEAANLCAIHDEWRSGAKLKDRIARIAGTQSGGLNGSAVLVPGDTTGDDGDADNLRGWRGNDWMFANVQGGGVLDTTDATGSDRVTDV